LDQEFLHRRFTSFVCLSSCAFAVSPAKVTYILT
jgi:hypothetical protein